MNDITVQELKNKIDNNEQFIFIDVREQNEYDMYNLKAKLIPLGTLPERINEFSENKNDEIVIHCRSGMRSATAKNFFVSNGYTNVRNLLGGVLAWQEAFEKI